MKFLLILLLSLLCYSAIAFETREEVPTEERETGVRMVKAGLQKIRDHCINEHGSWKECFTHYATSRDGEGVFMSQHDFAKLLLESEAFTDQRDALRCSHLLYSILEDDAIRWDDVVETYSVINFARELFEDEMEAELAERPIDEPEVPVFEDPDDPTGPPPIEEPMEPGSEEPMQPSEEPMQPGYEEPIPVGEYLAPTEGEAMGYYEY